MWIPRVPIKPIRRILSLAVLVQAMFVVLYYVRLHSLEDKREVPTVRAIPQLHLRPDQSEDSRNQTIHQRIQNRRRHVQEVCRKHNFSGIVSQVTGSRALNISVCLVQKAGCTQWIRIFKYLAGQKTESGNPGSISKYEAHYKLFDLNKQFQFDGADKDFIAISLRSMSVRHPFTRLWSAYVDKLVLPDFWIYTGRMVVSMMRKNPTKKALECGHDVTFQEFVEYVLQTGHSRQYISGDRHWLPASDICDPCQFIPDIVLKQESLVEDFQYTMKKNGLEKLFKPMFSQPPDESEIEDEIDYVFNRYPEECVTKSEIPAMIWKALMMNGYIPPNASLPITISPNVSKEVMVNIVKDVRIRTNMTSERKRYFRDLARKAAYSSLTVQQMAALKDLYKMDFLFFDYSDIV